MKNIPNVYTNVNTNGIECDKCIYEEAKFAVYEQNSTFDTPVYVCQKCKERICRYEIFARWIDSFKMNEWQKVINLLISL